MADNSHSFGNGPPQRPTQPLPPVGPKPSSGRPAPPVPATKLPSALRQPGASRKIFREASQASSVGNAEEDGYAKVVFESQGSGIVREESNLSFAIDNKKMSKLDGTSPTTSEVGMIIQNKKTMAHVPPRSASISPESGAMLIQNKKTMAQVPHSYSMSSDKADMLVQNKKTMSQVSHAESTSSSGGAMLIQNKKTMGVVPQSLSFTSEMIIQNKHTTSSDGSAPMVHPRPAGMNSIDEDSQLRPLETPHQAGMLTHQHTRDDALSVNQYVTNQSIESSDGFGLKREEEDDDTLEKFLERADTTEDAAGKEEGKGHDGKSNEHERKEHDKVVKQEEALPKDTAQETEDALARFEQLTAQFQAQREGNDPPTAEQDSSLLQQEVSVFTQPSTPHVSPPINLLAPQETHAAEVVVDNERKEGGEVAPVASAAAGVPAVVSAATGVLAGDVNEFEKHAFVAPGETHVAETAVAPVQEVIVPPLADYIIAPPAAGVPDMPPVLSTDEENVAAFEQSTEQQIPTVKSEIPVVEDPAQNPTTDERVRQEHETAVTASAEIPEVSENAEYADEVFEEPAEVPQTSPDYTAADETGGESPTGPPLHALPSPMPAEQQKSPDGTVESESGHSNEQPRLPSKLVSDDVVEQIEEAVSVEKAAPDSEAPPVPESGPIGDTPSDMPIEEEKIEENREEKPKTDMPMQMLSTQIDSAAVVTMTSAAESGVMPMCTATPALNVPAQIEKRNSNVNSDFHLGEVPERMENTQIETRVVGGVLEKANDSLREAEIPEETGKDIPPVGVVATDPQQPGLDSDRPPLRSDRPLGSDLPLSSLPPLSSDYVFTTDTDRVPLSSLPELTPLDSKADSRTDSPRGTPRRVLKTVDQAKWAAGLSADEGFGATKSVVIMPELSTPRKSVARRYNEGSKPTFVTQGTRSSVGSMMSRHVAQSPMSQYYRGERDETEHRRWRSTHVSNSARKSKVARLLGNKEDYLEAASRGDFMESETARRSPDRDSAISNRPGSPGSPVGKSSPLGKSVAFFNQDMSSVSRDSTTMGNLPVGRISTIRAQPVVAIDSASGLGPRATAKYDSMVNFSNAFTHEKKVDSRFGDASRKLGFCMMVGKKFADQRTVQNSFNGDLSGVRSLPGPRAAPSRIVEPDSLDERAKAAMSYNRAVSKTERASMSGSKDYAAMAYGAVNQTTPRTMKKSTEAKSKYVEFFYKHTAKKVQQDEFEKEMVGNKPKPRVVSALIESSLATGKCGPRASQMLQRASVCDAGLEMPTPTNTKTTAKHENRRRGSISSSPRKNIVSSALTDKVNKKTRAALYDMDDDVPDIDYLESWRKLTPRGRFDENSFPSLHAPGKVIHDEAVFHPDPTKPCFVEKAGGMGAGHATGKSSRSAYKSASSSRAPSKSSERGASAAPEDGIPDDEDFFAGVTSSSDEGDDVSEVDFDLATNDIREVPHHKRQFVSPRHAYTRPAALQDGMQESQGHPTSGVYLLKHLVTAIASGRATKVKHCVDMLLKYRPGGITLDTPTRKGEIALLESVRVGHYDVTEFLLEKKASCDACVANEGITALHYACRKARTPLIYLLLSCGASVTAATTCGETAFFEACRSGVEKPEFLKAINTIIEQRVDVNESDPQGTTALMMACKSSNLSLCKLLVRHRVHLCDCKCVFSCDQNWHAPILNRYHLNAEAMLRDDQRKIRTFLNSIGCK